MDKSRILKPGAGEECYKSSDFYIGGSLVLHGHTFELTGADDFAIKFIEAHPELFAK
jgi:hypothetical protein